MRHLEKGRVVILAGGIGNPSVSTDFAMVLRANEIEAVQVLKGTKVDGVYTKDPKLHKDAKLIPEISYDDYHSKHFTIVDGPAVTLAREHSLPIKVFNIFKKRNLRRVLEGEVLGSVICDRGGE